MQLFGDGNVTGMESYTDVAQAEITLPNRLDVVLQFRIDRRLRVQVAAIRPKLITHLKRGALMLVARRLDLTDCGRSQFRYVATDSAFRFAQSGCQFAVRRFEATRLPIGLQANESE